MKTFKYKKKVNAAQLHRELQAAGYRVTAITTVDDNVIVSLHDTEAKDPKTIVEKHIAKQDKSINIRKLKEVLKKKGIITDYSEIED